MSGKILFITSNRLGDAVLSTGLVDSLVENYGDKKITIACGPLATSLFEGTPNVDEIISLKKQKRAGHWFKLWKHVVGTPWDMVIDLRNSAVSRLIMAKSRYIFGPHVNRRAHKVEQNAQVVGLAVPPAPRVWVSDEQMRRAEDFIPEGAPVLAVGPAANWIGKTWAQDRFIEVISRIRAKDGPMPGCRLAVFAAPGEETLSYPVLESVEPEARIDMIAKTDPGTAGAALRRCQAYLGNDSGLMHLAAAAGIPTFGLFGPSWPHLYAPWGEHTAFASTPETFAELTDFEGYDPKTLDHSLMDSLTTDTVYRGFVELMRNR